MINYITKYTLTLILFLLLAAACSDGSDSLSPFEEMNYRKIAYVSLTDQEKESIISDWQKAPVKQGKYHLINDNIHQIVFDTNTKLNFALNNDNTILLESQNLVTVTFNTNVDALLGPIIVIIDPKSEQAIGYTLRF